MVTYALSTATGQALVNGLHTEFMADLPQRIAESAYLNADFKQALQQFYTGDPTPRRMADALYFGIIGSELADDSSHELGAQAASLHGPSSLFEELPTSIHDAPEARDTKEVVRQLAELIRTGDPSATVLELVGLKRDKLQVLIDKNLPTLLEGEIAGHTLHVGRDNGGLRQGGLLRLPSLSILESSLQYIYGEQAPHFCHASYVVSPGKLNALHELDFRMIALALEAFPFDGRKPQPPIEQLFHDLEHTLDYVHVTPFQRRVGSQLLRILEQYGRDVPPQELFEESRLGRHAMRMTRRLVLDLQADMTGLSRELLKVFNPKYALAIGDHFLAAIKHYQSTHTLSSKELEELHTFETILAEGLNKTHEAFPMPSSAIA